MDKENKTSQSDIVESSETDVTPKLEDLARLVLDHNDQGSFTIPAEGLYPHQWLWDSCFIAIGLRHHDIERAKLEVLSLLRGQWANGMLPHVILNPNTRDDHGHKLRDINLWQSWRSPNAPDDVSTSGITQPPMVAEAVVRIGDKLKWPERRAWYKMVYPALVQYHEWLYAERDPHHEGLVLQIHPWETGLDDSTPWMYELHSHLLPLWIRFLKKSGLQQIFGWFRSDTKYVPAEERASNIEELACYSVERRFRRKNYDFDKIIDHSLFAIEDLVFNSILIRANQQLKHIAKSIREELPESLRESMAKTEKTLEELWDPYANEYFSRDFVTHRLLKESSVAALLPLYAGSISKERAEVLVRLLENEHRFGPAYPIPSAPLDSPWFSPIRYWQGPSWVNLNWLIIDGLKRYGYDDHAEALKESTLEMVGKSGGFYEYFNPLTGEGLGANNFSWTAALVVDLLRK
jgi:hypothetical protein